jgi:serine/threonine protein phosphatase PrpC
MGTSLGPVATVASDAPFACAADSHPGLVRSNNEDLYHFDRQRGIFLVVDGVGGEAGGEAAADAALRALRATLEEEELDGPPPDRIRRAIAKANSDILRLARRKPELQGMACVLTVALVDGERLTVGHVGDSRLYKLRGGAISKLTRDHSPIGEREDRGELSEADAMSHPRRNEVYRDVGSSEHGANDDAFVDLIETSFERDCALVLCTDGLTDLVTAGAINSTVLAHRGDPYSVVQELIRAALAAGGKDNVTVVYVEGADFPSAALDAVSTVPAVAAPPVAQPSRSRRAARVALRAAATTAAIAILGVAAFDLAQRAHLIGNDSTVADASRETHHTLRVGAAPADGFSSIQEAIDAAQAGDIVSVGAGEYPAPIRLKDGVTLVSNPRRQAVIVGPADGSRGEGLSARAIRSARVEGFRLLGTSSAPIAVGIVIDNSRIELSDAEITGTTIAALDIGGASEALIRGSDVHDNQGAGVIVREPASVSMIQNLVSENGKASARPGLELIGRAAVSLFNNVFLHNGPPGVVGTIDEQMREHNFFLDDRRGSPTPAPRAGAGRH